MKKLIIAAIALSVSVVASADFLYWMVGDDIAATAQSNDGNQFAALYVTGEGLQPNDPAQLMSVTGSQVYNMYDPEGGTTAFAYSGIETYNNSAYKFYVEILADGAYKGNKTEQLSYSQLSSFILGGTTQPTSAMMAGFGGGNTTYNVPEPTSGLLFLVGGMLLGLKRRRQQV